RYAGRLAMLLPLHRPARGNSRKGPLTPALSLWERGPRRAPFESSSAVRFANRLTRILPLPKGEGWGEGEERARRNTNSDGLKLRGRCANPFAWISHAISSARAFQKSAPIPPRRAYPCAIGLRQCPPSETNATDRPGPVPGARRSRSACEHRRC